MKLEAGKKYVTRDGEVVECIAVWTKEVGGFQATVVDTENYKYDYTLTGAWQLYRKNHKRDIVAEHTPKPRPFRVGDETTTVEGRKAKIIHIMDESCNAANVVAEIDGKHICQYLPDGTWDCWQFASHKQNLIPILE